MMGLYEFPIRLYKILHEPTSLIFWHLSLLLYIKKKKIIAIKNQ